MNLFIVACSKSEVEYTGPRIAVVVAGTAAEATEAARADCGSDCFDLFEADYVSGHFAGQARVLGFSGQRPSSWIS